MVYTYIDKLVGYGIRTGLITDDDRIFARNSLLDVLRLDEYKEGEEVSDMPLEDILAGLLDYAVSAGLIEDSIGYRDLFDTKLMSCLTPRPSEVIRRFYSDMEKSAETATDNFYKFSCDTDYIRRYRIVRDMRWKAETEYGELDITINLSKPEKDPKAIAAARNAKSGYPKCLLCEENVGYAGRIDHPARGNHRIIPIEVAGEKWGFQYSPYVYYNEHCIVFNRTHTPMVIDRAAFDKLLDIVTVLPHYFVGSNADLPIVGGSILAHEHFQGGRYTFAMEKAQVEKEYTVPGFEDVSVGRVKWPMSVLRLRSKDRMRVAELAEKILNSWRRYSDPEAFIFADTEGEPHNTVTPIARRKGDEYEMDIVLRNNITTKEHPLGVFHPHAELHHIKKENIGLIEVMGLAVLPSRLKAELERLGEFICEGRDYRSDSVLACHADWADTFAEDIRGRSRDEIDARIRLETGKVFARVLEHAGVYKRDSKGQEAFDRFVGTLSE